MIDFDTYLLEFVRTNIVTLSFIVAILKVIAIQTPWAIDDKIIEVFTNFLNRKDIKK